MIESFHARLLALRVALGEGAAVTAMVEVRQQQERCDLARLTDTESADYARLRESGITHREAIWYLDLARRMNRTS